MSNNPGKAIAKQPWDAKRVGNLLLNNALFILMFIAIIYIAIRNPNFIKPASLINIIAQTAAYLPVALGVAGCIVLTGTDLSAGCSRQWAARTRCGPISAPCRFQWSS